MEMCVRWTIAARDASGARGPADRFGPCGECRGCRPDGRIGRPPPLAHGGTGRRGAASPARGRGARPSAAFARFCHGRALPRNFLEKESCQSRIALLKAAAYLGAGSGSTLLMCGRGGTGRRATLRSLWAKARGSSSLLDRTSQSLELSRTGYSRLRPEEWRSSAPFAGGALRPAVGDVSTACLRTASLSRRLRP